MEDSYVGTESFYEGGSSSLSPDYGNFVGYRMSANQLGFPGSPQTPNQLGETVTALKQGVKAFEVALITPDTTETIPKEHFKEMRALMKLSGVKPSVHGPMLDPAGFGERGWGGNIEREDNERRMFDAIEKAHVLDPNGNIPIVFHGSAGTPGPEFKPGEEGKRFEIERMYAINKDTKQLTPIEKEYKFSPLNPELLTKGGVIYTPETRLETINESEWEKNILQLAKDSKEFEGEFGKSEDSLKKYKNAIITDIKNKEIFEYNEKGQLTKKLDWFNDDQLGDYIKMRKADVFGENVKLNFTEMFGKAYKYGSDVQKKELKDLSEDYSKAIGGLLDGAIFNPILKKEIFRNAFGKLNQITSQRLIRKSGERFEDAKYGAPKIFEEVESFAGDKAADTFGNLAMKSYNEFGGSAPVIAIENFHSGTAFSSAEKLKELVNNSRDIFVKQLVNDKNLSESEAKKIAEKQIGVTWDVGHLNMLKKKGFTDVDVLAETKKISEDKTMVKHLHLTDNFGFADSHLAPGMGNVPFKKIMEQLEKTGRLKEMRKIVEAGGFAHHFKKSPHGMSMAAFGSPIYGMSAGPYWNQAMEVQGSYFGGYGTLNPDQHHSMYGSGFTTMPIELGGQMLGDKSRFGGTPMA